MTVVNGVPIVEFPAEGRVVTARTKDESSKRSFIAPVFGVVKTTGAAGAGAGGGGYVAVYGDSNCADSAHRVSGCDWLFSEVLPLLTGSSAAAGGAGDSEEQRQKKLAEIGKAWSAVGGKDAQVSLPPTRDAERSVRFSKHSRYWASSSAAAAASGKGKGRRQAADAANEDEQEEEEEEMEEAGEGAPPRFARTLLPAQ